MESIEPLLDKLEKLAKEDAAGKNHEPKFSIYVIEVENLDDREDWDFYVGSTGKTIEERFKDHRNRRKTAWRKFKCGVCKPKRLHKISKDFPKFYSRLVAEQAEGDTARFLRSLNYKVGCNKLAK